MLKLSIFLVLLQLKRFFSRFDFLLFNFELRRKLKIAPFLLRRQFDFFFLLNGFLNGFSSQLDPLGIKKVIGVVGVA